MIKSTNLAMTKLDNVYVLAVNITSSYDKVKLRWYFLVRKINGEYFDLFTKKIFEIHFDTRIVNGILGEYDNYYSLKFESLVGIGDFTNRFKGMEYESYAALSEFSNYINILGNMVQFSNVTR